MVDASKKIVSTKVKEEKDGVKDKQSGQLKDSNSVKVLKRDVSGAGTEMKQSSRFKRQHLSDPLTTGTPDPEMAKQDGGGSKRQPDQRVKREPSTTAAPEKALSSKALTGGLVNAAGVKTTVSGDTRGMTASADLRADSEAGAHRSQSIECFVEGLAPGIVPAVDLSE